MIITVIIFIVIIPYNFNIAQNVTENLNSNIYNFLERLEIKNVINLSTEVRPFYIGKIKQILKQLQLDTVKLTEVEREQLKKYLKYYNLDKNDFFLPYYYHNDKFEFRGTPILGYNFRRLSNFNGHTRVGGASIYTTYSQLFSMYAHLQDKGEVGDFYDDKKLVTLERGYDFHHYADGIEYSDVIGGISYDWGWGNISLQKDYNEWGHGKFGQLILSTKVNSFPHIKFEFNPIQQIRFRYIFGWLNSKVIDSNYYYNSNPGLSINERRYDYINKFFVANFLTFEPWDFLKVSAGNSIIYSGSVRLETFLPLTFFKYLDRDVGKGSVSDGNGNLFFDAAFNYFDGIRIYSTLLIDVISIRKTLKGDYHENWIGYTIGVNFIDKLIKNSDLTIEYTKIGPWVYEHKDITTTYKHLNYTLGHWIGQNADLISINFNIQPLSDLRASVSFQKLRKGGEGDISLAYQSKSMVDFLYPPSKRDLILNIRIEYELISSFIFFADYQFSDISDELYGRTPEFMIGSKHYITFGFSFGFPY